MLSSLFARSTLQDMEKKSGHQHSHKIDLQSALLPRCAGAMVAQKLAGVTNQTLVELESHAVKKSSCPTLREWPRT